MWLPTRKTIRKVLEGEQNKPVGSATLTLERVNGRICFRLAWSGIKSPLAAHIHEGPNGPAVLPLFVDAPKRRGCVKKVPGSLIRKIADCPGSYHVKLTGQL
jgi:CHRD domain